MTDSELIAAEISRLEAEQTYWEGMRRNASWALADLPPDEGMYTNNAREELKALLANAIYHLQQIAQELNRLQREREEKALKVQSDQMGRTFG